MTGLLLIAVAVLWIAVVIWLVRKLGAFLPQRSWRKFALLGICLLLLPLPLFDEIVGGWQFAQVCKSHDKIRVDREKIEGAKVKGATSHGPSEAELVEIGSWLPIRHQEWKYLYEVSGAPALEYDSFHATGGWLIRTLGISEHNAPLLFRDSCYPTENPIQLMRSLKVTVSTRPAENSEGK